MVEKLGEIESKLNIKIINNDEISNESENDIYNINFK